MSLIKYGTGIIYGTGHNYGESSVVTGIVNATLAPVTSIVSGSPLVDGTVSATLLSVIASIYESTSVITGTVISNLNPVASTIIGTSLVSGSVSATLSQVVADIEGGLPLSSTYLFTRTTRGLTAQEVQVL